MGVFNKINQYSGVVTTTIVISLVLFMLGADFFANKSILGSFSTDIGEVDGHSITREEFTKELESANKLYGGNSNAANLEDIAWGQVVFNNYHVEQFELAGITISAEEEEDLLKGDNMHEVMKQFFGNAEGVEKFLSSFEDEQMSEEDRKNRIAVWKALKQYVRRDRLTKKYEALITKTEYATLNEAKHNYQTMNDKVEVKYVYVPYASIEDSTVEVTDEHLTKYLKEHKNEFKVEAGRSIEFVVLNVTPAKLDSLKVLEEVAALKEEFVAATNDSLYVAQNSETQKSIYSAKVDQLPEFIQNDFSNISAGKLYGPYASASGYQLTKVVAVESDTIASAKASHILFQTRADDTDEKKKEQKDKALQILKEIQSGASFEKMAAQYGSDGTASRGGSLGWFGKGVMVKPFEEAIFGTTQAGLLPRLVETQFGYHIVRVDVPKTNKKFKLATVDRPIITFETTRDSIYRVADELAASIKDTATLRSGVRNTPGAIRYEQQNVEQTAKAITSINEAAPIIKWLYNDETEVNSVSEVFTLQDKYVVVLVTGIREKGTASLKDVKDQIKPRVVNERKAAFIKASLATEGTLESIAKAYGAKAQSGSANEITLSSGTIGTIGYEPEGVGYAFGLAKGQRTAPIEGENGVYILELVNKTSTQVSDYVQTQKQVSDNRRQRLSYGVVENVFRTQANIEDFRYRY
ncbi:MAG: peptidylprolyl isomerase [Cytophagaceae bacterium]|jgi:parvulin-like peptidyl-prolyl isomerase|nr:peptidylprolyl isomerase [Cytophagaceae bacterium]